MEDSLISELPNDKEWNFPFDKKQFLYLCNNPPQKKKKTEKYERQREAGAFLYNSGRFNQNNGAGGDNFQANPGLSAALDGHWNNHRPTLYFT